MGFLEQGICIWTFEPLFVSGSWHCISHQPPSTSHHPPANNHQVASKRSPYRARGRKACRRHPHCMRLNVSDAMIDTILMCPLTPLIPAELKKRPVSDRFISPYIFACYLKLGYLPQQNDSAFPAGQHARNQNCISHQMTAAFPGPLWWRWRQKSSRNNIHDTGNDCE